MRRLVRAVVVVAVIMTSALTAGGTGTAAVAPPRRRPRRHPAAHLGALGLRGGGQPARLPALDDHERHPRRARPALGDADQSAWGKPLVLRFAHEMNGDWYPWSEGVNGNAAGQYVPAYRRVVSLFRSVGATNVTWVWSPNVAYPGSVPISPGRRSRRCGRSRRSRWCSPRSARPSRAATRRPGSRTFFSRLAARPEVRGFLWFNHDKEADWRVQSSDASRMAYARAVAASRYV